MVVLAETLAVVWAENEAPDPRLHNRLKDISEKINVPPMTAEMRQFVGWMANYTLTARGTVLRMSLRMMLELKTLGLPMVVSLNLSDRVVDVAGEAYDCAVRVGDLPDSSLVSVRLADNRRLCVASPAYLQRHGRPQSPADLVRFDCLTLSSDASQTRGWAFRVPPDGASEDSEPETVHLRPAGPMDCSDGQVLREWCLAGYGIAWRSTWEVEADIAAGRLETVLEEFAAAPNGIYALFPQRKHLALRVRLWIDFLKHHYAQTDFWSADKG